MEEERTTLDLSAKSFDEFVDFFFARDVVPEDAQRDYFQKDLDGREYERVEASSPAVVVRYMTRLFSDFAQIASGLSLALVDQALWALEGASLSLPDLLWNESVPLSDRMACIRSMYHVFSDYTPIPGREAQESGFYMWWDHVLRSFWLQLRFREAGIEDGQLEKLDPDSLALLDTILEALQRILALPDRGAQTAALHGFGHLHHPDGRQVVQDFIERNRLDLSDEELSWIEQCRDGTAL